MMLVIDSGDGARGSTHFDERPGFLTSQLVNLFNTGHEHEWESCNRRCTHFHPGQKINYTFRRLSSGHSESPIF